MQLSSMFIKKDWAHALSFSFYTLFNEDNKVFVNSERNYNEEVYGYYRYRRRFRGWNVC